MIERAIHPGPEGPGFSPLLVNCVPGLRLLPTEMSARAVYIFGCPEIEELPIGMQAVDRLWLEGCTAFVRFDDNMAPVADIILRSCPSFRNLPQSWASWPPYIYGFKRQISLFGTAVQLADVQAIVKIIGKSVNIVGAEQPGSTYDSKHPLGLIILA